jgi:hypothetical protein
MAIETEEIPSSNKEMSIFRGMGVMTGQTFSALKGFMFNLSISFELRGLVAIKTETGATICGLKRFFRSGGLMASIALNLGDRRVSTGFQKLNSRRRVRIMTTRAGGFGHGIVTMGLSKRSFRTLMAGQAEGGLLFSEKARLIRTV